MSVSVLKESRLLYVSCTPVRLLRSGQVLVGCKSTYSTYSISLDYKRFMDKPSTLGLGAYISLLPLASRDI